MTIRKDVRLPKYDEERIKTMEEKRLDVRVEHIPAHKYLGIWEERAEEETVLLSSVFEVNLNINPGCSCENFRIRVQR